MHQLSCKSLSKAALLVISCVAATSAPGCLSQRLADGRRPTVSLYSSASSGLLDSFWDPSGHVNLESQLASLELDIAGFGGKANSAQLPSTTSVYVIPPLTGDRFYSDVEDIDILKSFVGCGGLVFVHNCIQPQATQDLIADILDYGGSWQYCEAVTDAAHDSVVITPHAREFLDVHWPMHLEDVPVIQAHSWCKHEDPDAVSYPLYTLGGDDMKVVVQAFTRVGSPGAVMWLGYSWQGGPQAGWGAMVREVITSFAAGSFHGPSDASLMDGYPLRLGAIVQSASEIASNAMDVVRRFLLYNTDAMVGVYPLLPLQPAPSNGQPPLPPPPPPSPEIAPPSPQQPVRQPPALAKRFSWFHNMTAHGAQGTSKPVVWFDDGDFANQVNMHYNNSKLWLVDRNLKPSCSKEPPCRLCQQAWYPYNGSDVTGFPKRTVVLYFREPVILKRVTILELASKNVEEVFLLGWPAVPIPNLGLTVTRFYDSVNRSTDVFTDLIRTRLSVCSSRVEANVKPPRSDDPQLVPGSGYNQTHLPPFFQERAVGGVGIRLRARLNPSELHAHIAQVLFSGRVLYPQNPSEYDPYPRPYRSQ